MVTVMNKMRSRTSLDIPLTNLMWPDGIPAQHSHTAPWENDLGLADLVNMLSPSPRYKAYVRQTLFTLVTNAQTIQWRQAVLADFAQNPALIEVAESLLPRLHHLQEGNALLGKKQRNLLLDTADQLAELDDYLHITQTLHDALCSATLKSTALIRLRDDLTNRLSDPNFQALRAELPELRAPLEHITSLTVGINLDVQLRPHSAVLMAINDHKMTASSSWLERAIGLGPTPTEESGIAQLHRLPDDPQQRILAPLFQDLDKLLTEVATPVAKTLTRYVKMGTTSLAHLEYELAFFTTAARLKTDLESRGFACCWPEVAALDERVIQIDGLVNIALARREQSIPSDIDFGADGRIAVLTGPNSGGKTTYLRTVGLAQVMFQVGLFIPAQKARISPVDHLLTHFPVLETRQQGRLAEEATRLREIFQQATSHSLVLLNETFSSTSSGEAVYLAQDILCGLRARGLRAIFATHLIELAENLAEIESRVGGESSLFSLVAGVTVNETGEAVPTYRIERSEPLGRSYAREIARRHGISLEQILEKQQNK